MSIRYVEYSNAYKNTTIYYIERGVLWLLLGQTTYNLSVAVYESSCVQTDTGLCPSDILMILVARCIYEGK